MKQANKDPFGKNPGQKPQQPTTKPEEITRHQGRQPLARLQALD